MMPMGKSGLERPADSSIHALGSYRTSADLGGTTCTQAVVPEPEGELFHAPWEPQALALTLAMGATGQWNIDMSRAARETLPNYASLSYYEIWIHALEVLLLQRDLVTQQELESGQALLPARQLERKLVAADVAGALARGTPVERPATVPPRFAVGQRVRMRMADGSHHTRLPGYCQGHAGHIERVHGMHVFADTHAHGLGEQAQWLYTVVFSAGELWGDAAGPNHSNSVDAWESYLEPL